jgi:hypothetical protein
MMKHFCSEYIKHFKVKSIMQTQRDVKIQDKYCWKILFLSLVYRCQASNYTVYVLFWKKYYSIADPSLSGFNEERVLNVRLCFFHGLIVNQFCQAFVVVGCWLSCIDCRTLLSFVVVSCWYSFVVVRNLLLLSAVDQYFHCRCQPLMYCWRIKQNCKCD